MPSHSLFMTSCFVVCLHKSIVCLSTLKQRASQQPAGSSRTRNSSQLGAWRDFDVELYDSTLDARHRF